MRGDRTDASPAVRKLLPAENEVVLQAQPVLSSPTSAQKRGSSGKDRAASNPVMQNVIKFLQSPNAVQEAGDFVKNFWASCNEIDAVAGSYVSILEQGLMFKLLNRIAILQGEVLRIFHAQFGVHMPKLTKQGIIEQAEAWKAMRQTHPDTSREILLARDKAIQCLDEAFNNLPFALFDPVSCAYFLAHHALVKTINKTEKTTLLFFQVKALAQVSEMHASWFCLAPLPH